MSYLIDTEVHLLVRGALHGELLQDEPPPRTSQQPRFTSVNRANEKNKNKPQNPLKALFPGVAYCNLFAHNTVTNRRNPESKCRKPPEPSVSHCQSQVTRWWHDLEWDSRILHLTPCFPLSVKRRVGPKGERCFWTVGSGCPHPEPERQQKKFTACLLADDIEKGTSFAKSQGGTMSAEIIKLLRKTWCVKTR